MNSESQSAGVGYYPLPHTPSSTPLLRPVDATRTITFTTPLLVAPQFPEPSKDGSIYGDSTPYTAHSISEVESFYSIQTGGEIITPVPIVSSDSVCSRCFRHPVLNLIVVTTISVLNYCDRGITSGCLTQLSSDAEIVPGTLLDNTAQGLLGSAFMIGLVIASPIFAEIVRHFKPFKALAIGLVIWEIAVVLCGASTNYWMLVSGRALSGVGEGAFASVSPSFIDDRAPAARKGLWFSVFYSAVPVGYALGYVLGGVFAQNLTWRAAYYFEACLMLPFICLCWLIPYDLKRGKAKFDYDPNADVVVDPDPARSEIGDDAPPDLSLDQLFEDKPISPNNRRPKPLFDADTVSYEPSIATEVAFLDESVRSSRCGHIRNFGNQAYMIFGHPVYTFTVIGYAAFAYTVGAVAFVGPSYLVKTGIIESQEVADMAFGAVCSVGGLLGTVLGGLVLDGLAARRPNGVANLWDATRVTIVFTLISIPCMAVVNFTENVYVWVGMLFVGQVALWSTTTSVNCTVIWTPPLELRPASMAMCIMFMHVFGDVPSPFLFGVMADDSHIGLRKAMLITTSVLLVTAVTWLLACIISRHYIPHHHKKKKPNAVS